MICEDCPADFEVKVYGYKRMYPDKCPACARRFKREKLATPLHGERVNGRRTKLYVKWVNMKMSCFNPKYKDYRLFGAVGITVCDEWKDYKNFHKWAMSKFYVDGMTLKRIDNTADFTPKNCRFIMKRANVFYEYRGEKHTIHTLKKALSSQLSEDIIRSRLGKGWNLEDAFLQPRGFKMRRNKRKEKIEKQKELLCLGHKLSTM